MCSYFSLSTEKPGRKRRPENWISNIAKRNKAMGISYLSPGGVARRARQMGKPCELCRSNCSEKITYEQRRQIFDQYYQIGDLNRQREYIGQLIDKTKPKERIRRQSPKPNQTVIPRKERIPNLIYRLPINGEMVRVCGQMFRSTFDISKANIVTIMRKTNDQGLLVEKDLRGGNQRRWSKK